MPKKKYEYFALPVQTPEECRLRYNRGEFGNRLPDWANPRNFESDIIFQGNVTRNQNGLDLLFSYEKLPFHEALEHPLTERVYREVAVLLLAEYLSSDSLSWLYRLLEEYPNHNIVFTTYNQNWGNIQGHNTVFWEIRNY
jgi:hypothetical protein